MGNTSKIPPGWTKGEPLVISRRVVRYQRVWFVEQRVSYSAKIDVRQDATYACWFFTWEEFAEFLQWWYANAVTVST